MKRKATEKTIDGKRQTYVSARTIRVREEFSMVNLVLPSCPAIRPNVFRAENERMNERSIRRLLLGRNSKVDRLTYGSRKVITVQGLDVFDLERVEIEVVHSEQCDGILSGAT